MNGITLIALIVTIIVLLILAGVALSLVTGSDGILSKAERAVEQTNNSTIKEEVELAIIEKMTEYYENYADYAGTYRSALDYAKAEFAESKNYTTASGAKLVYDEPTDKFIYTKNGQETRMTVNENGNVTIEGTEVSTKRTVSYNANGGEGNVPASASYEKDAEVTVAFSPAPTKTGYTFIGWATSADATEATYMESGTTTFTMGTSNVALYAVYEKNAQTDGSWTGEVNSPKLEGTGLTAIYWDGTTEVELTDASSSEEWDKWYDYSNQQWANAVTKDSNGKITGYWVWIPRYEYSISGTSVSVKFIPTSQTTVDSGYTYIHPSFTDGSTKTIPYGNGEWDKEIAGFWVAKYPAGYQASTINSDLSSTTAVNTTDTIIYSSKNYTNTDDYVTNAIGDISTSTAMSYPVFKPLTYVYNCISIGDSYTLAQEIKKGSSFYGLNSSSTYSHMMKNSEWGAVAYLTQSSYGRSGTEVNINNMYLENVNSKNIYQLTGVYSDSTNASSVTSLSSVYAYNNTTNGVKGSSTGNLTGVYDLNGCVWEMAAGYITNGNDSLLTYGSLLPVSTTANANGYKTLSTKYVTVYPYNSSTDNYDDNWTTYNGLKTSTYGYGDAILETSTAGSGTSGWNSDYSYFPHTNRVFFNRGGWCIDHLNTGAFAFSRTSGSQSFCAGFRVVLVCE